jgi:hypothetical protein
MTELTVKRESSRNGFTPGELLWDGRHEAWTCEDVIREVPGQPVGVWKVPNQTAIPSGRYRIVIDFSEHFGKKMPLLLNVPGFEGVRIHVGNTAADTEGCLLIGDRQTETGIAQSAAEFNSFLPRLDAALAQGEAWITYINPTLVIT